MIKVYIDNYKDIADWYSSKIVNKVFSKKQKVIKKLKSYKSTNLKHIKLVNLLVNIFNNLKENDISNLLTLQLKDLNRKYRFIKEYVHLIKNIIETKTNNKTKNHQFISFINNSIKLIFDYKFIPLDVKRELVYKLNIRVCPYCNRQFIQPITINNVYRYICDLDHIKPKSKFPLFSMSLWNLLPSCKPCNQSFKNQQDIEILSPYEDGFDDDVLFNINYKDLKSIVGLSENLEFSWEIIKHKNSNKSIKLNLCKNNIDLFHLNEVYATNKREIMDVLKKRYNLSKAYERSLDNFNNLNALIDERTYYGVSLVPREFQNEMLSKVIYDIIYHN